MANKERFNWQWLSPCVCAVAFAVVGFIFLYVKNHDYLFMAQGQSLFVNTSAFLAERMAVPGGLLQWAGCYLTQFFYYPALGSSLLIIIWLATYFILLKTFKVGQMWTALGLIPLFALLCSTIDLGYWLYYLKMPGYWFVNSVGFLLCAVSMWISRHVRGWYSLIWIVLWTAIGYPLFGWSALLGTLYAAIFSAVTPTDNKTQKSVNVCVGVLSIVAMPLLWYQVYPQIRFDSIWTYGFPWFQAEKDSGSPWMVLPFYVVVASPLLLVAVERFVKLKEGKLGSLVTVAVIAAGAYLVSLANFDDYNYQAEMRMYKYAEDGEWDRILEESASLPGTPTRQMVTFKNLALLNTGQMGSMMYHYDNGGKPPVTRDSLKVRMVQTAAPMIYYCFGRLNFATRWSIENNVEFGVSINNLKVQARCALLNGEANLLKRYTNVMRNTMFYKEYAEELDMLSRNRAQLSKDQRFAVAKELHDSFSDVIDGDDGLCEMYILNYFGNTFNRSNKLTQELTLNYAMINKSIPMFWPKFFVYAQLHANEEMPIHYQEAAFLYGVLENKVDISQMPFDKQRIIERYSSFNQITQGMLKQGMTTEQVGESTRATFGDTFWWFYFFCRNVKSY